MPHPKAVRVSSLQEASSEARKWIEEFGLGGGNFPAAPVTRASDEKLVGHISYNGRIWEA